MDLLYSLTFVSQAAKIYFKMKMAKKLKPIDYWHEISDHFNPKILSLHWQQAPKTHAGQTLICNQVISKVSVSLLLSLTQQTTSAHLYQGRLLWETLSSGSVINNCLHPLIYSPSLPVDSPLNTAPSPQDGDNIKHTKKKPTHNPLDNFSPSKTQSQWHHLWRDRGCAKDKCLEMHYIILH